MTERRSHLEALAVGLLLLAIVGIRLVELSQPILENYVGRQIPTAMVARNLDRGSGFLHPQLDTGPFPNLFLVEPPIYEAIVVAVRRIAELSLGESGRLVSAIGTGLGGWGLFGLARRREKPSVALVVLAAYGLFPITIRYGRAFQPDALSLGFLIAGLYFWDKTEQGACVAWRIAGWLLLSVGLAMKVIFFPILLPLIFAILRPIDRVKVALALATLLPALFWYGWAAWIVEQPSGSRASIDSLTIWARVLIPRALFGSKFYLDAARFLFLRCFTPLGFLLAIIGWWRPSGKDRLWSIWAISSVGFLMAFAGKAHHEYYWWTLAPVVAIGFARGSTWLLDRGPSGARLPWCFYPVAFALMIYQAQATWRTPPEWALMPIEAKNVARLSTHSDLVVAPEALLYQADRRGCRLEFEPEAVRRAAGEWGGTVASGRAIDLVLFYRDQGARYFADLKVEGDRSTDRLLLQDQVRRRFRVLADDNCLIADLSSPGGSENGQESVPRDAFRPERMEDPGAKDRRPDGL